jgi:membrane protease YdiL (CAAX protease family)
MTGSQLLIGAVSPLENPGRFGVPMDLGELRVLKPGRLRWLRAVAWMVAFIFIIALAFGPVMEAARTMLPKDNAPIEFLVRCGGAIIALVTYAALARVFEGRVPNEIALKSAISGITIGLSIGLVMMSAAMAVLISTGLYDFEPLGVAPAWRQAGMAIESGIVEELMIRGIMLRLLWRAFGPFVAFTISAAAFGAGHLANPESSWFAVVCIALEAGIMLGAFYALTGRLWVSIGVHAGWNFTQGYLFGAAVSGGNMGAAVAKSTAPPGLPDWLTGGGFGPEASLPALTICTLVGIITLWLAWRAGRFAKAVPA